MAIDRLPSGRNRARLMIDGQPYTATLPTEDDARIWEIEARVAVALRRSAERVTFAAYAARWLEGFLDDAPDRARFEAALEHQLLPVFGQLRLLEVPDADGDELHRRLANAVRGGDGDAARECLELVLENAIHDLLAGVLACRGAGTAGLARHHSVA